MKNAVIGLPSKLFILCIVILAMTSITAEAGLRGHWKLDEVAGLVAVDSAGSGNDGVLNNGPVWTPGQIDGGLNLDGLNDHVSVDSAPLAIETWSEMTVAAWVKNDIGPGAGTDDILSWWRWNGYPCSDCSFVLTHHRNNQYFFEIKGTTVSGGSVDTAWTHVVATYDGSTMRLYLNGNEEAATPRSGVIPFSSADLIIASQGDGSNYFDGTVDDVRIYDVALSAQEVTDLFDSATLPPDVTPPSRPENLTEVSKGLTFAEMNWTPSDDPESGIDHYNIYKDSVNIAISTAPLFVDNGLQPGTTYQYEVSAVNGQGLESLKSLPLDVTTDPDTDPPTIVMVDADETVVVIEFNEVLDPATAQDTDNYTVSNGIMIFAAVLEADEKTVSLTTSPHSEGIMYDLSVVNVEDVSGNPMPLTIETYSVILQDPFLEGYWNLDDGSGSVADDTSGNGNDGTLVNGPVWTAGGLNGALYFDGQNDFVIIDPSGFGINTWASISVGAWIKNDVGAGAGTDDIISQWNYPSSRSWILTHHRSNQYFWEIAGKGFVSGGTVGTTWTHVMGTYDGSTMRLYVNGIEVDSLGGLSGTLPSSSASIIIGGQADGSLYFDGVIDEVRIYGRTLSATEVQDLVVDTDPGQGNIPPTVTAGASVQTGAVPLDVQFSANAQDQDGFIVSYSWDFGDGSTPTLQNTLQNPTHTYTSTGDFTARVEVTDNEGATAVDTLAIEVIAGQSGPATFDLWYGLEQNNINIQRFGNIGLPQSWANVLGNVFEPDGISSLSYTLNGGPPKTLSIGPDDRRLNLTGDVNIDIDVADLQSGFNTIVVTATDLLNETTTKEITVDYNGNTTWPLLYSIDWGSVSDIQDAIQVVDGKYTITPEGLRISEIGYDRVIAIGDISWADYEIAVPITVNDFEPGYLGPVSVSAGFGITMRWTGHTDNPVYCPQPHCGWLPSGAGAWYDIGSGGPLVLDGLSDPTVTINVGDTFIWKMRVETIQNVGPLYSLKVWPNGQQEPSVWNIQRQRGLSDMTQGSLIINLHHVDATIGDLAVIPVGTSIPDITPPTVNSVGTTAADSVLVIFSEPVDTTSATTINNYVIDNGIVVTDAVLGADERTVTLTTNAHLEDITYTIQISGVADLASNVMDPVQVQYAYTPLQPMVQLLFEEGGGTVASDTSGNGNDGTLINGTQWFSDPEGGSVIYLDGVNDYVTVAAAPLTMNTWDQFTVSTWVKNDVGAGAGTDDIIGWWNYPSSRSWILTHHGNNQYFFEINGNFVTGGVVSTDWTHVAATYDGSAIKLYVNGSEVATRSYSGGIPNSTAPVIIGGQADGSNYFDGSIDNVEIFDVALSEAEVLSLFNDSL